MDDDVDDRLIGIIWLNDGRIQISGEVIGIVLVYLQVLDVVISVDLVFLPEDLLNERKDCL